MRWALVMIILLGAAEAYADSLLYVPGQGTTIDGASKRIA